MYLIIYWSISWFCEYTTYMTRDDISFEPRRGINVYSLR